MTKKRHKMMEHKGTLAGVFKDAKVDLEELREEMSTYYDNLPEGLQESEQGTRAKTAEEQLGEAYNAIEDLDFDGPHGDDPISYQEMRPYGAKVPPRRMRAATIGFQLKALNQAAKDLRDEYTLTEDSSEWSEAAEALGDAIESLDTVEFPGMYGQ